VLGETRVLDVGEAGRWREAGELIFEYIAATEAELGHPVPAHHADLPSSLAAECDNARSAYPPPGTVLIADRVGQAIGCVALRYRGSATAEVKRLYVRPAHRGGVGRALMLRLHEYAARHRLNLQLDVLAIRRNVIALYRDLGYRIIEPAQPQATPLVVMERRL
jgi:ribosomal protein S18 acetylase RimI-like enzyme